MKATLAILTAILLTRASAITPSQIPFPLAKSTCIIQPAPPHTDSAPAIRSAFAECGHNCQSGQRGRIVFLNETYHVKSALDTRGLSNVDIDLQGSLLWDTDIPYWLSHSLPVGYQNQSSAWLLGGHSVTLDGHGYGTLDGNGQVWYDFADGRNNVARRPHAITFSGIYDSEVRGVRFVQSQMWTMTVIHANNVLMEDIYINSTDAHRAVEHDFSSLNTDGIDTIYANNITLRRWTIDGGDDHVSTKANSTNILVEDCDFYTGLGVAIGSIGQYNNVYETIQNVTVRNIRLHNTRYGAYFKTWTGVSTGYPPNGGGGGLGFAANISFENFHFDNASGIFAITQCTSYNGVPGGCDSSPFEIRDVYISNWTGTVTSDVVAEIWCSGVVPCHGLHVTGVQLLDTVNATAPAQVLCRNVKKGGLSGVRCTGEPFEENYR